MRTRTSIAIGGRYLHELDGRIVVQSIVESPAKLNPQAVMLGSRDGQHLSGVDRQSLDVAVNFCIMGRRDVTERTQVLEDVAAWAAGSDELMVDYRPNRVLYVTCVQYPAVGDAKKWNDVYTVQFRAFGCPYWQRVTPDRVWAENNGTARMQIITPAPAPLEIALENTGSVAIDTAGLQVGAQIVRFEDLALAPGEMLVVRHEHDGRMAIIIHGEGGEVRGAYDKRAVQSDDEIYVKNGINELRHEADGPCRWTFLARGRYL